MVLKQSFRPDTNYGHQPLVAVIVLLVGKQSSFLTIGRFTHTLVTQFSVV